MSYKIKKGDTVKVTSGDDKGKTGKVLRISDEGRVVVEGINMVWKHMRKSQQHPQGARIQKEATVSIASVMVICQSCGKPARIGMKFLDSGDKVRICKKCKDVVNPEAEVQK